MADQALLSHLQHEVARLGGCSVQMMPIALHLGKGDGRNTKQITLHGGPHGAGINGVVAHVGTVVDTRQHQVRAVVQQPRQGDVDTISRRAIDIAKTIGRTLHIQRCVQGQRIGLGAVVVLGGHHFDRGDVFERLVQRHNARSPKTIVVANKNFHHDVRLDLKYRMPMRLG